jgi:hypothetical protein
MPRKEFDAFTRLDASDVNTFLMDQSVMTFGSATARDAAIDTPVEGQVTYLTDIDSLSVYNGTQWVTNRPVMSFAGTAARGSAISSPVEGMVAYLEDLNLYTGYNGTGWGSLASLSGSGLVHLVTETFTAQSAFQINTCFSAEYDVYKIIFNNLTIASGDPQITWQLVSGTTPITSSTYNSQRLFAQSTSVGGSQSLTQTSSNIGFVGATSSNFVSMEISSPFLAAQTKTIANVNYGPQNLEINYGRNSNSTSYDGIRFAVTSSNMSGTVRIYGYRNA